MRIHMWGTRGSIAVAGKDTVKYGGNTSCVEVELASGNMIIIDAGTGIRALGQRLLERGEPVNAFLLITHIHWDHVLGFPFFGPVYEPSTRLHIDGCFRTLMGIKTLFQSELRDGFFPVRFDNLKSTIQFEQEVARQPVEINGAQVESIGLQHPHGGLGFKIIDNNKTLVFLTDNELTPEGAKGRRPIDYARFCQGADLLIHDGQYTPEEIVQRHWWGHSDYASVLAMAKEAGVKRLLLTHHDYSHTDRMMDEIVVQCREKAEEIGFTAEVDAAKEETYTV